MLQKKKLKMGFCGCSDTRRAFSRACIAKCAYHKPSLSRRMGAALPLRPCGSATRRRPSRRGPQRPWGHRAGAPPPGERASGGKAQTQGKKGISSLLAVLITEYKMPLAFCLFEVRLSEIRDQVRGPKARMRSILSSELACQARDGAGPRSARTDSPMPAALSFFHCTALRARRFHFFGTRRAYLFFVVWADFE